MNYGLKFRLSQSSENQLTFNFSAARRLDQEDYEAPQEGDDWICESADEDEMEENPEM
jgi:hypothetical protein